MITKEELIILKVNANRWYLGKPELNPEVPVTSDKEYDRLEKLYGHKATDLVDWSNSKVRNSNVESRLEKVTGVEDFLGEVNKRLSKISKNRIINYKYDGSAIRAEYSNGELIKIISTPDEEYCMDITEKFRFMFPESVSNDIRFIRGELIVDPRKDGFGQKARNKANGLVISKYQDDEIKKYAQIRAYNIEFTDELYDFNRLISNLDKLPENDYFKIAERLDQDNIPTEPIVLSPKGDSVLVDGIVIYTEDTKFAIKFYFTDIKPTTIKDIEWRYNEKNGGYTPTYIIDPVILNEKTIRKVATGGVKNMIKNGGIGTSTYVILSKMTIPKIYTNLTYVPNIVDGNYGDLSCECGSVMDIDDDLYGSNLRCPNVKCSKRIETKKARYDESLGWEYNLNEVLGIDRFKVEELSEELIDSLNELKRIDDIVDRVNKFEGLLLNNFSLTELQKRLLELNSYSFCLCF